MTTDVLVICSKYRVDTWKISAILEYEQMALAYRRITSDLPGASLFRERKAVSIEPEPPFLLPKIPLGAGHIVIDHIRKIKHES